MEGRAHGEVTLKVNRVNTYGPVSLAADFPRAPDSIRAYLYPNGTVSYIDDVYLGPVVPPRGSIIMLR
jgi:hypothetical protein